MNEVVIPIKMDGLGSLRSQLKELKQELQTATDPADIQRLSQAAGELKDRIGDANDQINVFASGSKFEQVSRGFGGIKDSLMSLDFEEAAQKSKAFSTTLASINPATMAAGIKGLTSTVTTLGTTFIRLGVTLLANPLFLIVALVTGIIVAVGLFLKKIGVLDAIFKAIMIPINFVIDGLKAMGDWLGITSFEADANKEAMIENGKAVKKANEEAAASSQVRANIIGAGFDFEIKMAKINGESTTQLEINKSKRLQAEAEKRLAAARASYDTEGARNGKAIDEEKALIVSLQRDRALIVAQDIADTKKANEEKAKERKKAAQDAAKANKAARKQAAADAAADAKDRLNNARTLKDYELSQIKDDSKREIDIINEKYTRLLNDLKADANKTKDEKAKFTAMFKAQQIAEVDKINEAKTKAEQDNLKKNNEIIADLTLELMQEGTAKDIALQEDKYKKLRAAALADTTLTETQRAQLEDLYAQQDKAETQKRIDERIEAQTQLALSLKTEQEQALINLEDKYTKEKEIAKGNYALLEALKAKHDQDIKDMDNKAALEQIESDKNVRDAKIAIANDIAGGLTNIGGMLIKDQVKLAKFNKASALIQIGIDTAKALSALVAASNANPFNATTAGAAGIAQYISGALQIATNMAKAKQILSSGGSPTGGGSAGGGTSGGGSNVAQAVPSGPNLFGQGNNSATFGAGGSSNESSMTVTAIVSETQVTTVQDKINRINKNAEL